MNRNYFWTFSLRLHSYTFFKRKENFVMHEDIYDSWVMFIIDEGSFQYQIKDESGIVEPGDILICPPGVNFQRTIISPIALHFISFEMITTLKSSQLIVPHFKTTMTAQERLESNLIFLKNYHLTVDTKEFFQQQHIVNDFWQLLCNDWDKEHHPNEFINHNYSNDPLMNDAYEWLIKNVYTKFNLRELSDFIGLSPVQFSRRFQREFHTKPSEFVKKLRIQKVARLLLETNLTLEQIAERSGYENAFYLSRVFTRFMGVSPSRYRTQNIL